MRASLAFAWVVALLAAAAPLPTQQEPPAKRDRRPMVGTVVGSDERAIAGAFVVVAHVPAGEDSLPARHHATATTDARGRFHVDVLAGVDYRVFAIGPPDERGSRLVSEVQLTTANTLLTLRATERMPVRTFRLEHAERWREFAPLRLRVLPAGAELPGYEQALGDDGRVTLPPLPSGFSTFEVLTAGGVLATSTVRSNGDVTMQATKVWDVPIELVDSHQLPVGGAEVQQHLMSSAWTAPGLLRNQSLRQTRRILGTSDASGRFVARVPRTDDPFGGRPGNGLLLVATAPGHRAAAAGACGRLFEGAAARDAGADSRNLRLMLAIATPPRVWLHWDGLPQAGVRLDANGLHSIRSGQSTEHHPFLDAAATDAYGHATFATLPAAVGTAWLTAPEAPAATRAHFPADAPPPRLLLPLLEADYNAVLDVDLAKFRRLHLRLLGPNHAPAQTARLVLTRPDHASTTAPAEFPVDPTGQWTALVPPGPWWAIAVDGGNCAIALAAAGPMPQVLQFRPMRIVEGRVLDAKGQGVANAVSGPVEFLFDDSNAKTGRLQSLLTSLLASTTAVSTSADGTFRMPVPDLPGTVPSIHFRLGWASSNTVAVEGTEPIELVIPGR